MYGDVLHDPQAAVDKLFADVADLAAPGSSFLFDFLHSDAVQGLSHPVGYANTAKVPYMHAYTWPASYASTCMPALYA